MKNNGMDDIKSNESRDSANEGFLGILRRVAIITTAVGAVGALGLMLRASQSSPRFLLFLFVIWVLSPFAALAWANMASKRWSVLTRAALYCVTLIITLSTLAIFGGLISPPAGSPHAFVFVIVPPASWLLLAIVVPAVASIARRRSH